MGYAYEYTYQDCEYIIRTMNTKYAQLVTQLIHTSFPAPRLHTTLHSVALSVIKLLRQC